MKPSFYLNSVLVAMLCLVAFAGCHSRSGDSAAESKQIAVPLPSDIRPLALVEPTLPLSIEVLVDAGTASENVYTMENLQLDDEQNTLVGDLSVRLTAGTHTMVLIYYWDDGVNPVSEVARTAEREITVQLDQVNEADLSDAVLSYVNQDGDLFSDFLERLHDSDPNDANSQPPAVLTVDPRYAGAPNWLDYVQTADTATACDGTVTGNYFDCIHGGERKVVEVTGETSCDGLSAADILGVFNWECDDSVTPVRFLSTGLKSDASLADLINFSGRDWKNNGVMVYRDGAYLHWTGESPWWENTLTTATFSNLSQPGEIYIVTEDRNLNYTIIASQVALVVEPGVIISGSAAAGRVVEVQDQNFIWIEGDINATGETNGIYWRNVTFSVLRRLRVGNADGDGISLLNSSRSLFLSLQAENNGGSGMTGSFSNSLMMNLQSNGNTGSGLVINGSINVFNNIAVFNNDSHGVWSGDNFLNIMVNVYSAGNGGNGINLPIASDNLVHNVTVSNNSGVGIRSPNAFDNWVVNVISAFNNDGIVNAPSSPGHIYANMTVAHNTENGIWLTGAGSDTGNRFTGLLKIGNNGTDCNVQPDAGEDLGLEGGDSCRNSGLSDAVLTKGVSIDLSESFQGCDAVECQLSQFRINESDTIVLNQLAVPDGDMTRTWETGATTPTYVFLQNAVEVFNDNIGNENGLCESNETCLYTPNMGAYQGHGALVPKTTIGTGGILENIILMEYETNGVAAGG